MMDRASKEDAEAMFTRLFEEAAADMAAGRLAEAAQKLDTLLAALGPHPDVLWNLGTARAQLQQHDRALAAWDAYRRAAPDDWRARPKVIQACQALGDTARRDRERAELLALRRAGTDPGLAEEPHYCREQLKVGDLPVVAYEVFEPAGPQRVFYLFLVGQPDGTMVGRYSLGSYDFTTEFEREIGRIGPEERMYHLDWYAGPMHSTRGFYTSLPDYDAVRAQVAEDLAGESSPVGIGSRPPFAPGTHESGPRAGSPHPTPPPSPSPAPPDATRVATRAPAKGGGEAGGGTLDALKEWLGRLVGRGGRPN
jgi:tetratricopeptide (TPR) repeat protein